MFQYLSNKNGKELQLAQSKDVP